jgi:diguanylate cyclase (GGDEF)-like protein/putative nucleotidyltransferase with HDIG domain
VIFLPALVLSAWAGARCWAAGRRNRAWASVAVACWLGVLAAAAATLATAEVRTEQVFDAGLTAVLVVAVGGWYVAVPGIAHGEVPVTVVFLIDVAAVLLAAGAAITRMPRRAGVGLVVGVAALASAGGVATLAAAGMGGSPIAIAALWALAGCGIGYAATRDADSPRPTPAADSWPWGRALFPLPIVIALALLGIVEVAARGVEPAPIVYFGLASLLALVLGFARQAYLVVENSTRNADLEALTALTATMTESFDENTIVERGLEALRLGAHAQTAALHVEEEGSEPRLRAAAGSRNAKRADEHTLRLPLRSRAGELGTLTVVRERAFGDDDRRLVGLLAGQLSLALQNARDYREKLEQAIRDPLTGIYNRRFFYEAVDKEVQRQRRYGSPASLVVFDVDDFKGINDRHGHATGDDALRRVAATVDELIRASDTFARLGGEEFGLLLPQTESLDALLVAERIRTALTRRELVPGVKIRVSAGISSCPADGDSGSVLEKRADQALYWAKRNGKNLCALAGEVVLTKEDGARQHAVASLYTLVGMIDARLGSDDHSENVATYATALGKALGLEPERIVALRRAALLHDIGKLTVGEEVLAKPGPLNSEEFGQIWRHPVVGAKILSHAGLEEEARWVRHHHERVDGEGYPTGLRGGEIPLEARILFVADAFEGMTADRPYRASRSVDDALDEFRANAGSQFDRKVVAALCELVAAGELEVAEAVR